MNVPTDLRGIEDAAEKFGPTQAAKDLLIQQKDAAEEALLSGIYMTWQPKDGDGDQMCSRVGSSSACFCGHTLSNHNPVIKSSRRLPSCKSPCRCSKFRFIPVRPEEVGQWHLPRRKNFDLKSWQERIRQRPHEYACITCDQRVSDHEVIIEFVKDRSKAGLPVGKAFLPLSESAKLQRVVFGDVGIRGGHEIGFSGSGSGGGGSGCSRDVLGDKISSYVSGCSLERQFEMGHIDATAYHRQLSKQQLFEETHTEVCDANRYYSDVSRSISMRSSFRGAERDARTLDARTLSVVPFRQANGYHGVHETTHNSSSASIGEAKMKPLCLSIGR